jgi:ZIP family zinc transporter
MENSFLSVISFAFIPMIAAVIGAVIATFRPPTPIVRSYIQHTAGGVVFSVVAVDLLPDIIRQHTLAAQVEVAIGFALGVCAMLTLRSFSHKLEKQGNERPLGILVGVGIDILLDGFLISISFAAGGREGQLLTFALALELLSLGLAVAVALGKTEKKRVKVIRTTAMLFLLIVIGAGIGALVIPYMSEAVLEVVLSFGLAALMYLVTEELLVEAHKEPETPLATGLFFFGFLVFLLFGMAG